VPAKVVYFDDQIDVDTKRLVDRLQLSGEIKCDLVPPPERLPDQEGEPPDLFMIDQDLSHATGYAGSTLAEHIRQTYPDSPIILITRRPILADLGVQRRRHLSESIRVFDELILKETFEDRLKSIQSLVLSLAEGYRVLRNTQIKNWDSLVALLDAGDEEAELRQVIPPLSIEDGGMSTWTVASTAYWIRHVLLQFPGITYDSLHAATRLGLSIDLFWLDAVQRVLEASRYEGPLEGPDPRWWKSKLLKASRTLALEAGVDGPINLAFPEALQRLRGVDVKPPICIWDGTPVADRVCFVLQKPVKSEHSLRYYPDNRPAVMDAARVSFKAVRESDDFNPDLLDEESLSLLPEIEKLEEPGEK